MKKFLGWLTSDREIEELKAKLAVQDDRIQRIESELVAQEELFTRTIGELRERLESRGARPAGSGRIPFSRQVKMAEAGVRRQ